MSFVQGAPSSGPSGPAATRCVNVQEAKTHLSALLARVAAGERIVLSRHGKPIAQLVPLDPSPRRQLGFLQGRVDEAFFDPLPDDELERWG
jgi:prevent-host-death family protein